MYKLEIFKNLPFAKISTRENKHKQNLVPLRYAMFLSELPPLSIPSSDNTVLG